MRIAVTGATGFIGCNLVEWLKARNFEVSATGRTETDVEKTRCERLRKAGHEVAAGSLLDAGFASRIVAGCDVVIHLAAAQHEGNVPDAYFHDTNVGGTQLLIDASIKSGVRRFVYGSTIGVYGSAAEGELSESSPTDPGNVYERSKLEAEQVVNAHKDRIETCLARISEAYGPADFRLLKLFRAIKRDAFIILGSGLNRRQPIFIDDLAQALLLCAQHAAACHETFNLAGSEVMTTNDMVRQIATAVSHRPPRMRIPVWPFRAAAAVLETTLRPLGIQPPLTQRRLNFFTKSFVFSTVKCREVLGFSAAVPFQAGAAATARWYAENGYL
jgi:nucleoside-diphosphate-sugar epimerase